MDAKTLARVQAAVEADATIEAGMTPGEWCGPLLSGPDDVTIVAPGDPFVCGTGNVSSRPNGDPIARKVLGNARGIVRARNRWRAHIALARATTAMIAKRQGSRSRPPWWAVNCGGYFMCSECTAADGCEGHKSWVKVSHATGCPAMLLDAALAALAEPASSQNPGES